MVGALRRACCAHAYPNCLVHRPPPCRINPQSGVSANRSPGDEALVELARASELAPDNARYAYAQGVALNSLGRGAEAITILETAARQHPSDREILTALTVFHMQRGELDAVRRYARQLARAYPDDVLAGGLLGTNP